MNIEWCRIFNETNRSTDKNNTGIIAIPIEELVLSYKRGYKVLEEDGYLVADRMEQHFYQMIQNIHSRKSMDDSKWKEMTVADFKTIINSYCKERVSRFKKKRWYFRYVVKNSFKIAEKGSQTCHIYIDLNKGIQILYLPPIKKKKLLVEVLWLTRCFNHKSGDWRTMRF